MVSLYYFFKHSGKNWRMMMLIAQRMSYILHNLKLTPAMKTKIEGYFKKMTKYEFVGVISVYRDVLQETSQVSLKMEKESSFRVAKYTVFSEFFRFFT